MSEPHRTLFIITHDLTADASARYLLRRALAAHHRGSVVTIVLRDRAAGCVTQPDQPALVTRMLSSGATLYVQAANGQNNEQSPDRSAQVHGVLAPLSDDDLGDLLLTPGVEAHWC